jgi:membrane protease YdiL (CAAX protease family)
MLDATLHATYRQLIYLVGFATIGWTLYVVLMKVMPLPFAHENLRAVVRVAVVLLPALHYVIRHQPLPIADALQLRQNWRKGVLVGGGVALVYLVLITVLDPRAVVLKMPIGFSTWFNYIIGSPLAEEILYRGVLFQYLSQHMTLWRAALLSTAAFTLMHIPVWILLNEFSAAQLMTSVLQIAAYGIVFALLCRFTRSLWAPLTAHWLNNLILSIVVRL